MPEVIDELAEEPEEIDDLADVPEEWRNASARKLMGPHPDTEEDPQARTFRLRVLAVKTQIEDRARKVRGK